MGSVSCITLAGAHAPVTKDVTGFYAGAALAYNDVGGKYTLGFVEPVGAHTYGAKLKHSEPAVSEGLFVGYNHNFCEDWFVGVQAGVNYYNNQTDKTDSSISEDGVTLPGNSFRFALKRTWGYGLMVDVGYVFSPQVYSYVGLQTEYAIFKGSTSISVANIDVPAGAANKTKNVFGFGPAVGMGYRFTKNLTLGAQYAITFFPPTRFGSVKSTPRNNAFRLSLSWGF